MKFVSRFLTTPLGVVAGGLVLVLSLITVVDVTSRALGGGSVPGALEISEMLLVVCVFAAFGAAQRTRTHVATSVLTERLPRRARRVLMIVAAGLASIVLVAMVVAATQEALRSITSGEYRFGLVHVPLWPAKLAVAVGMLIFLLEFVQSYFLTKDLPYAGEVQVQEILEQEEEAEALLPDDALLVEPEKEARR